MSKEQAKPAKTVPGTVKKIIKPRYPGQDEKAEIEIEEADHLYREIRVDNTFIDPDGRPVGLKPGAHVDVTLEAEPKDTVEKPPKS